MKEDKSQQTKANGEAKFFSIVIHVSTGLLQGLQSSWQVNTLAAFLVLLYWHSLFYVYGLFDWRSRPLSRAKCRIVMNQAKRARSDTNGPHRNYRIHLRFCRSFHRPPEECSLDRIAVL